MHDASVNMTRQYMVTLWWGFALSVLSIVVWVFGTIANHFGNFVESTALLSACTIIIPHCIWVLMAT